MNGQAAKVGRRVLLELWAMVLTSVVVGFLGPFGTYLDGDLASRVVRWWMLLAGAYILIRPTILVLRWAAEITGLPRGSMVFWGVLLSSIPMAWLWRFVGGAEVQRLVGVSGLVPFSSLCALLIIGVARWATQADAHLLRYYDTDRQRTADPLSAMPQDGATDRFAPNVAMLSDATLAEVPEPSSNDDRPETAVDLSDERTARLYRRLKPGFVGDIIALESEDHYVRVHGLHQSELLFLRLRDAIAEMDGVAGEQTHRSWWVANGAVARVVGDGRNREIELAGGLRAPVARDSIERLRASGFLPA